MQKCECYIREYETGIGVFQEIAQCSLCKAAPELLEALTALFEHCAMIHKHWGDGGNQREADLAITRAKVALTKAEGQ